MQQKQRSRTEDGVLAQVEVHFVEGTRRTSTINQSGTVRLGQGSKILEMQLQVPSTTRQRLRADQALEARRCKVSRTDARPGTDGSCLGRALSQRNGGCPLAGARRQDRGLHATQILSPPAQHSAVIRTRLCRRPLPIRGAEPSGRPSKTHPYRKTGSGGAETADINVLEQQAHGRCCASSCNPRVYATSKQCPVAPQWRVRRTATTAVLPSASCAACTAFLLSPAP
jgi:hypothetical protein